MIFVVGGGGGSGKLSGRNHPTIHANVPLNSTIEFIFGGQVIDTVLPSEQIPNQDGETADYYYAVSLLGEWTIRINDGTYTNSKNIRVSANRQYDTVLKFVFIVFEEGVGFQNGFNVVNYSSAGVDVTNERIQVSVGESGWGLVYYTPSIPGIKNYTKLQFIAMADMGWGHATVGLTASPGTSSVKWSVSQDLSSDNKRHTVTIDISSLADGTYYVQSHRNNGVSSYEIYDIRFLP